MVEEKTKSAKRIENFLKAMALDVPKMGEDWPQSASQMAAYFDADQSVDIYLRINKLIKDGMSYKEIGRLFMWPAILRYFIITDVIGLKIANATGLRKISIKDRVSHFIDLVKVLETMVYNDPFCLDGKELALSKKQLANLQNEIEWIEVNNQNEKIFSGLVVDLFAFSWSFFYNLFIVAGLELHGAYDYSENGKEYKLVVRDAHDMNPEDVWNFDTGLSPVTLYLLYEKDVNFQLSFTDQALSEQHNQKLVKAAVRYDDKFITNPDILKVVSEKISNFSIKMTNHVNSMSPLDQVRKGAYISFYMIRKIYDFMGDDWRPDRFVEPAIEKFGTEFIDKRRKVLSERSDENWLKVLDPRTDFLDDVLTG